MRRTACLAFLVLVSLSVAPAQQVQQIDELVVEYRQSRIDVANRRTEFTGGVTARYGLTVVRADRLSLDMEARNGVAEGAVRLDDPDGMLTAARLEFNWRDRTGSADEAELMVGNVKVRVRLIEVLPDQWTLYDAWATPCGERRPALVASSRKVVLRPGRSGRASSPKLSLFGVSLGTIPFADRFSLDNRVTGLRLPSITSRRGEGLGVSWASSVLVNDQTSLSASYIKFPKSEASFGAGLAWSAVSPTKSTGLIYPRTELSERFAESYFDNIGNEDPAAEHAYLGAERRTLAASSLWNQGVRGRWEDSDTITKRFEAAGEAGGDFGWGLGFLQLRYQSIQPSRSEPFRDRLALHSSAATKPLNLARGLTAGYRLDLGAYAEGFSWARSVASMVYEPVPGYRAGIAWIAGGSKGRPRYAFDRLYSQKGLHLRGDARIGPLSLSGLFKYDFDQKRWYDHEYLVSIVAGCFEPFIIWRQFPSDVKFGVRLRTDALTKKLGKREFKRSQEPRRISEH